MSPASAISLIASSAIMAPTTPVSAPTMPPCAHVSASGGVSGTRSQSLTNRLWEGLSAHVYVFLHQTRLSDVIRNEMQPCPAVPALFRVVDEE